MNTSLPVVLLSLALAAPLAWAHDPAMHAKEAAEAKKGPDCSAMDHSKMDMNDPVQQALMTKCGMTSDQHANHGQTEKPGSAGTSPAGSDGHAGHSHGAQPQQPSKASPKKPTEHGGH